MAMWNGSGLALTPIMTRILAREIRNSMLVRQICFGREIQRHFLHVVFVKKWLALILAHARGLIKKFDSDTAFSGGSAKRRGQGHSAAFRDCGDCFDRFP